MCRCRQSQREDTEHLPRDPIRGRTGAGWVGGRGAWATGQRTRKSPHHRAPQCLPLPPAPPLSSSWVCRLPLAEGRLGGWALGLRSRRLEGVGASTVLPPAMGREGLPCSFRVDQKGFISWQLEGQRPCSLLAVSQGLPLAPKGGAQVLTTWPPHLQVSTQPPSHWMV